MVLSHNIASSFRDKDIEKKIDTIASIVEVQGTCIAVDAISGAD